jgi:hypothetical protein
MADPNARVETWTNGVLVDTQILPRDAADYNRDVIEERAVAALTNNIDYLAIASPTSAQAAAQIKDLTRQMNGIIRLLLNRLDSTD